MLEKNTFGNNFLKTVALIAVLSGAAGSLVLMFRAGRHQSSILLIVLFTIWVLSPFMALLAANAVSTRWPVAMRRILCFLVLFISLGSLVSYSGALSPPGTKPAFKFLVVPLASWVLITTVIPISRKISRKKGDLN